MKLDHTKLSQSQRFEHLLAVVSSERFLKMEGLGNEIPFFICPFRPHESIGARDLTRYLVSKLANDGIQVLQINLYDLALELLKERGILEQILEREPELDKGQLRELLQNVLDSEAHLIPAIAERMQEQDFHVMFITGVGEVFPYIRSHNVLNNLQSTAKDRPTVMFFPGEYEQSPDAGASLNLFGRLPGDNYYRAFNIYHFDVPPQSGRM